MSHPPVGRRGRAPVPHRKLLAAAASEDTRDKPTTNARFPRLPNSPSAGLGQGPEAPEPLARSSCARERCRHAVPGHGRFPNAACTAQPKSKKHTGNECQQTSPTGRPRIKRLSPPWLFCSPTCLVSLSRPRHRSFSSRGPTIRSPSLRRQRRQGIVVSPLAAASILSEDTTVRNNRFDRSPRYLSAGVDFSFPCEFCACFALCSLCLCRLWCW